MKDTTKKKVGRPKGYRCSKETKERISKSMVKYYLNMTDEQKDTRQRCNKFKSDVFKKYYELINNLI
jgi:hypothetical protein